jgi:hypothetical protein
MNRLKMCNQGEKGELEKIQALMNINKTQISKKEEIIRVNSCIFVAN